MSLIYDTVSFISGSLKYLLSLNINLLLCGSFLIGLIQLFNDLGAESAHEPVSIRFSRCDERCSLDVLLNAAYLIHHLLAGIYNKIVGIFYNKAVVFQQIRQQSRHLRLLQLQSHLHPQAF